MPVPSCARSATTPWRRIASSRCLTPCRTPAAWSAAISFGLGLMATLLIGRRVVALPIPWESLARCGVATGLMALVVSRLPAIGGFGELMLDAGVGVIVYAAAALTLNAAGVRTVALSQYQRGRSMRSSVVKYSETPREMASTRRGFSSRSMSALST